MRLPAATEAHFPNEGSSAGAARRFVAAALQAWGLEQLEEVACLLVSELASNVVLHAGTELDVHVRRADGRVRVEVHDGSARLPEMKRYSPTSTTGRGLVFIAQLAQAWGTELRDGGKVVWFELDEVVAAAPPPAAAAELHLEDWDDLAGDALAGDGTQAGSPGAEGDAAPSRLLACRS